MAKNSKKYIDGLVRRPISEGRTVGIDGIAVRKPGTPAKKATRKPATRSTPKRATNKSTASRKRKIVVEGITRADIAEEFVQPVGTLDFGEERADLLEQAEERLEAKGAAEKEDKKAAKKAKKAKKPKKKWSKKRKIVTGVVGSLVGLIVLAAVVLFIWGDAIISKLTGGKSGFWDIVGVVTGEQYVELKKDENGRTNILIFGTSGYDMSGSDHDGAQLTDSVMVVSLDQGEKDLAMISLPRDLKVGYTCTATGKLNEVYWCHNQYEDDEEGGAKALEEEVEEILGINIHYYAHLNWGALVSLVDILGGITVTLDEDVYDYGWTDAVVEAGVPTELNGAEALALARARHGTQSGDFTRAASQQKIIIAIEEKLKSRNLSITDMLGIANALGDNLRTNFSLDEMKTGAHLLSEFSLSSMREISLLDTSEGNLWATAMYGGISYVVPAGGAGYYNLIQDYVRRMLSSDPAVREDASLLVLNGTGVPGTAAAESERLEAAGYRVENIGDVPGGNYTTSYSLFAVSDDAPATRKALEQFYGVAARGADELPAGIWADGYDFVVIVGGASE